jgi:hypothetical protein
LVSVALTITPLPVAWVAVDVARFGQQRQPVGLGTLSCQRGGPGSRRRIDIARIDRRRFEIVAVSREGGVIADCVGDCATFAERRDVGRVVYLGVRRAVDDDEPDGGAHTGRAADGAAAVDRVDARRIVGQHRNVVVGDHDGVAADFGGGLVGDDVRRDGAGKSGRATNTGSRAEYRTGLRAEGRN